MQHGANARDQQDLRDLCHLVSSCNFITGQLVRRQETFVSLIHVGKATETAVHMSILITFRQSIAGHFLC